MAEEVFKAYLPGGRHTSLGGVASGSFAHYRVPGQVPSRDNIEAMRLMSRQPKPFNPMQLFDHTEPRMTIDSVLDGLGMDTGQYNDWRKFLQKALTEDNELTMRRDLLSKMMAEGMVPELRRALFQRALVHYKGRMRKSLVDVISIDDLHAEMFPESEPLTKAYLNEEELRERHLAYAYSRERDAMRKNEIEGRIENLLARTGRSRQSFDEKYGLKKADAKGGNYHRRVTNKAGKHRYYYDPEQYGRSKDAHVDGNEAAANYIQKTVKARVEKAGEGGCPIDGMKDLVKRYGSEKVGDALKQACANGGLVYKGKKLYLNKSVTFVMEMK